MACVSWATTRSKALWWSSQCAKRCTPTNDRRGLTRTTAAPETADPGDGVCRGRPWRRLSCHCTRHRLSWRRLTAIGLCRLAASSSNSRLGHCGSSWSKLHNRACSRSLSFLPEQNDGLEPPLGLLWLRASGMTSSSLIYLAGCSLHIRPEGSMSVFILNHIRWLEPKTPIRVRSQYKSLWYCESLKCLGAPMIIGKPAPFVRAF